MIVWEFPCESRSLPGLNEPLRSDGRGEASIS